jgi:oligopeptide transport system ATP-binding protein
MYAGRLVETAPTEELYANPMHPYTIGLLASVPRLDSEKKKSLRVIKGLPPNLARLPGGCAFHPRCENVMDKCRAEYPPLEKVGENHYRACWAEISKLKKY